jgi:hypothetical protein
MNGLWWQYIYEGIFGSADVSNNVKNKCRYEI